MDPIVVIADPKSYLEALNLIGDLRGLNEVDKRVIIKVGIYNPESKICTTVETLNSIISAFNKSGKIQIVESDSGAGLGLERLRIWGSCFNEQVQPFNLSDDTQTTVVNVAGENVSLSNILFGNRTFVSTHVPRRYEETGDEDLMNLGSIIKNLLGLIPDKKKFRFHNRLPNTLLDLYEAIGGIDLAILDCTYVFLGRKSERLMVPLNLLIFGKDAFAVEAVGASLVGFNPLEMPVLQEAYNRELGEIDLQKIKIKGNLKTPKTLIAKSFNNLTN
ncbi:DUF362 domain-containing protein [Candidatus Hodarchaeum mangrovi]